MEYEIYKFSNSEKPVGFLLKNLFNNFSGGVIRYFMESQNIFQDEDIHGIVTTRCRKSYCDKISLSILMELIPYVEEILGEKVLPTYAYSRIYPNGSELLPHRDRPACEITISASILSPDDKPQKIFLSKTPNDGTSEVLEINYNPGDAVMFFGSDHYSNVNESKGVYHWRNPIEEDWIMQTFLHYVYAKGNHVDNAYEWDNSIKILKVPGEMVELEKIS